MGGEEWMRQNTTARPGIGSSLPLAAIVVPMNMWAAYLGCDARYASNGCSKTLAYHPIRGDKPTARSGNSVLLLNQSSGGRWGNFRNMGMLNPPTERAPFPTGLVLLLKGGTHENQWSVGGAAFEWVKIYIKARELPGQLFPSSFR